MTLHEDNLVSGRSHEHALPDGTRGAAELLLAALAGSALIPFIQAMATRAGEDLYARVRDLFRSHQRREAERQVATGHHLVLADRQARTILQVPTTISVAEARALARARTVRQDGAWTLVAWDAEHSQWSVRTVQDPPATAIDVSEAPGGTASQTAS
ncbi:hypothetical protein OG399_45520 [Streptomyces achromogenes]